LGVEVGEGEGGKVGLQGRVEVEDMEMEDMYIKCCWRSSVRCMDRGGRRASISIVHWKLVFIQSYHVQLLSTPNHTMYYGHPSPFYIPQ